MALKARSADIGHRPPHSSPAQAPRTGRGAATRAAEVTGILRDEILRGQYRAGERLPSERELANRFEVNRGAVREALKRLEQLGITDVQPGGVRVVAVEEATLEVLGHLIDLEPVPDPGLVGQLFEAMGALFAMSGRIAVERATSEELSTLRTHVQRLAAASSAAERHLAWRDLGEQFNQINGNLVLRLIGNGLKTQFMGRLERSGIQPNLDDRDATAAIDELDRAIGERNGETVATTLQRYFILVRDRILAEIDPSGRHSSATAGNV